MSPLGPSKHQAAQGWSLELRRCFKAVILTQAGYSCAVFACASQKPAALRSLVAAGGDVHATDAVRFAQPWESAADLNL